MKEILLSENINLSDYPPGFGKALILKRSLKIKVGCLLLFLLGVIMQTHILMGDWRYSHFPRAFSFVSLFAGLVVSGVCLVDCIRPSSCMIEVNQTGFQLYPVFGMPKIIPWNQIHQIKLRCWLGFSYLHIKTSERSYYFHMTTYSVNIKEFTELLAQWHQYYETLSKNTRMEQKQD